MSLAFLGKSSTVKRKKQSKLSVFSVFARKHPRQRPNSNNRKKKFVSPLNFMFDFKLNHDKRLFYTLIIIIIIGVIAIFSATAPFAYRYSEDNNKYFYLFNHLRLIGYGLVFLLFFYFIRIEFIMKFWIVAYIFSTLLLAYLLYLSFTHQIEAIDGSPRWLNLGGFQFQPSEFVKLLFIIFLVPFLAKLSDQFIDSKTNLKINITRFGIFVFSLFLVVGMILLTRNLGSALVVGFIGLVAYWSVATTKFQKAGFFFLMLSLVFVGIFFALKESYRANRIEVWLTYLTTNDTLIEDENGFKTREGKSYQLDQVLTAIGSGGILGLGLGQSIGKYYLPKTSAGDDSIFGVIGEELGFFIVTAILMLYLYMVFRMLTIASLLHQNKVYYLTMICIASWIGFQMFVHVGANVGVLPLTGQTLPFISLGGSSFISLMGAMGLALNVSKQINNETSDKLKMREVTFSR